MNVIRVSVCVVCAMSGIAVPALAATETEVQVTTTGDAGHIFRDANFKVIRTEEAEFDPSPLPLFDPLGTEVVRTTSQTAVAGAARAEAHLRAVAEAGRIGAGITLGAAGLNELNEPGGFPTLFDAVGRVNSAVARASYKDTVRIPSVPGVPNGTPIRVRGLLFIDIDGSFGVTATGTSARGRAAFQLRDVDGANQSIPDAPYSLAQTGIENCWGYTERVIDAFTGPPTNVDVTLEPPIGEGGGTVKVDVIGNVGSLITIGYEIIVSGTASSGDGAVAVSADFSNTVKWGGIEGIFDRNTDQLIAGLTIESESGFDYTRSFDAQVPEPSSLALVMAASCLWITRTRSRRFGPY